MIAPVAPCTVCGSPTPYDWPSCSACGAQRMLAPDGTHAGYRQIAQRWRRILATGLDFGIFVAVFVIAGFLPDRIADPSPTQGDEALRVAIALAAMLYFPVSLGIAGRTLGKRVTGIHVVTWDGSAVTFPRAAVRDGIVKFVELGGIAGGITLVVNWDGLTTAGRIFLWALLAFPLASLCMILGDERRKTLHDHAAATVCVAGPPLRAVSETAIRQPVTASPSVPAPAASVPAPAASAESAPAG
jgi:uncharacterized RDD family membrane protein YckC